MRTGQVTVEVLGPAEAEAAQRRCGGALASAGLKAGDRVALCVRSSAALLCAVLGAARSGVVPVLVNPTLTASERHALIGDAQPKLVVDDERRLVALARGPEAPLAPWPLCRPMHYTSGTTGRPKGVYSGLFDPEMSEQAFCDEADLWGFDVRDVHLVCSPLHHSVAIRLAAACLLRGGSLVVLSRFDATATLYALLERGPTTAFMVPSHFRRLLALDSSELATALGRLRLLIHAGEPCPPRLKRAVMERCGDDALFEFYGSTEGQFTVCSPQDWLAHPGTVGRARAGRRLFVLGRDDEEDDAVGEAEVGAYEVGTIWCEAPPFARFGYWGDQEATQAAWRGDAFSVGDLGHLDAEGFLYLSGRRSDLIISGGVNVYPAEVEAALAAVVGVEEVAVFGVADERWGQRVCAAVVGSGSLDEDTLKSEAHRRLAPYKRPKEYHFVSELPHTATGKLQRGRVAEALGLAAPPQASGASSSTTS